MYLEISARQTGKTHRLIKELIQEILPMSLTDGKLLVIAHQQEMCGCIEDMMWKYIHAYHIPSAEWEFIINHIEFKPYQYLSDVEFIPQIKSYKRVFFDEFDFMKFDDVTLNIDLYTLLNLKDAYWCTTAKKIYDRLGDDKHAFIFKLIDKNLGVYTTVPASLTHIKEHGEYLQNENRINTELRNLFIK
jgi:hypothetical protein